MPIISRRLLCISLIAALVVTTTACNNAPAEPWYREKSLEATATVVAIDKEKRLIALRDKDGEVTTLHAGSEVRNFDQINVNDQVVVAYYSALAAAVTAEQLAPEGTESSVAAYRAEPGEPPRAGVAASATATVKIDSVDRKSHTVRFHGEDGVVRAATIEDPKAREFIQGLKPGDVVVLTYAEAISISVRPKSGPGSSAGGGR